MRKLFSERMPRFGIPQRERAALAGLLLRVDLRPIALDLVGPGDFHRDLPVLADDVLELASREIRSSERGPNFIHFHDCCPCKILYLSKNLRKNRYSRSIIAKRISSDAKYRKIVHIVCDNLNCPNDFNMIQPLQESQR